MRTTIGQLRQLIRECIMLAEGDRCPKCGKDTETSGCYVGFFGDVDCTADKPQKQDEPGPEAPQSRSRTITYDMLRNGTRYNGADLPPSAEEALWELLGQPVTHEDFYDREHGVIRDLMNQELGLPPNTRHSEIDDMIDDYTETLDYLSDAEGVRDGEEINVMDNDAQEFMARNRQGLKSAHAPAQSPTVEKYRKRLVRMAQRLVDKFDEAMKPSP